MESRNQNPDLEQSALQQRAIEEAKLAYSRLPHGDAIFRQCIEGKETLLDVLSAVDQKWSSQKRKKSTKFLSRLQHYTTWLQNISPVVDVAVQTQAGFGCPVWAPIKFILKISNDHAKATEQISNLLESITESLPRLELYEKLKSDSILQVALLNVFTDVVDFSVRAFQFFRQKTLVRIAQSVVRSFDRDIGTLIARLERHARAADQTAVATELLEAAEFRKEAGRKQREDTKIQCERWLKPSDTRQVHLRQLEARLDGTCEWITSNDVFKRWVKPESATSHDRLLIVSGTHGCGKSVLASSIVARLENSTQRTLFFAFSNTDGSRQSSENLVRTLLWQMLRETTNEQSVDIIHRLSLDGEPTIPELWAAFGRLVSSLAKPVYCIVDGVDECIDYDHNMTKMLMQVLGTYLDLRILLLGRSHVFQALSEMTAFAVIEIDSTMLNQDVDAFINHEIAASEILSLPDLRAIVYKTLKERSDGMFLWVRLMVDDLKKSSSKLEFSERLQHLPRGLEKAYQLLFLHLSQRLDEYEQRLAQSILAFASTSCRPLRFDELRYALALHSTSLESVAQPLQGKLFLQPPKRVLDVTGGLVTITDGVLRLIHSSVRDFLIRPEDQWKSEPDRAVHGFRVDVPLTHRAFAWLCLDYMRLEKDEGVILKPDMSQSTQDLQASYPLLRYATLYAFFHLNRSDPPCSITIAKIEAVLKSAQSILWIEHFGRLLFEDITLGSQLDEVLDLAERLLDTDMGNRFYTIFEERLKEQNDQVRQLGKKVDPLKQYLEGYLKQMADTQSGTSSPQQSNKATNPIQIALESDPAGPNLQSSPRPHPYDLSATVSRVMDLLQGQNSSSTTHQIELWLRLSTLIRKTKVMIDPIKVLFRLILRKASGIHVYALLAIAEFYKRLEKIQEALEIYIVASRKMDHLDVPLKYRIYRLMGDCHGNLSQDLEALRSYEKAFTGIEAHFGIRHSETLHVLLEMITMYRWENRQTDILKLSDKICLEQEFEPELDLEDSLFLHDRRYCAYLETGNHERVTQAKTRLEVTLKLCCELCSNHFGVSPSFQNEMGNAYESLGEYDMALEHFQLALEISRSEGSKPRSILYLQYKIACQSLCLGRFYEAKALLETVHKKQQSLLGPDHREVLWTEKALDEVRLYIEQLDKEEDDIGLDKHDIDEDEQHEDESDTNESDEEKAADANDLNRANGDEANDEELITDQHGTIFPSGS